ncbi:SIR2 family protein [Draconibacterium orientale]|uniref:SIR2 family protein n=1 Tax=Draconibacterium orientale TaxID=1168034 RepID=UPI002A0A69DF|nr:SIR2 family protein [Draconibacterium orientale]
MQIGNKKTRTLTYLINKIKDRKTDIDVQIPKSAFLLGAGCSKSSEIPLGSEIISFLRQLWYIENFTDKTLWIKNDFEIDKAFFAKCKDNFEQEIFTKELELKSILQKENIDASKEHLDNLFLDNLYGFWFNNYSEDPRERQKIIEHFIDKASPSGAYILLAFLIENNIVKNIFTTNFDDLINQALIQYTETKARVYSHNEVARYINIFSCKPNIIKLHGDYLFENIKNTNPETETLEENMESKFREALTSQDLVVIGYNGADSSIMQILKRIKESTKFGLYWCSDNYESLNWRVKELLTETENSYFIEVSNFEFFIYKIYESFENIKLPDIRALYDRKQIQLNNYINKFNTTFQESDNLDTKQKAKINDKLSVILNDNSFKEVQSLEFQERIKYLRNLRIDGISRIIKNISTHFSRTEANELFETLDDGKLFQSKINDASIVHISNALTNLKEVDRKRTFNILNSVDSNLLFEKIKNAEDNELFSALGELGNIAPEKISDLKRLLKPDKNLNISKKSIRELNYFLSNISESESIKFIKLNKAEITQKLSNETAKEMTIFFENILRINKKICIPIYDSLSNVEIAAKIEKEEINQIGLTSHVLSKINQPKTFEIYSLLDENLLVTKALKDNFNSIQTGIFNISISNKFLAFKIIDGINDTDFIKKVEQSELIEIAEGLSNLHDINPNKIKNAYKAIDYKILVDKLNNSDFTYQQYGSTINKLSKLDYRKTVKVARSIDFENFGDRMIKSINKTGPQVFLHFLPIISKIDNRIIDIYTKAENKEFLVDLLSWDNFELYTVNLSHLVDSFKRNGMTKDAEYVEKVIKKNSYRFFKKSNKKHLP